MTVHAETLGFPITRPIVSDGSCTTSEDVSCPAISKEVAQLLQRLKEIVGGMQRCALHLCTKFQ